jgi:hypothetical protein
MTRIVVPAFALAMTLAAAAAIAQPTAPAPSGPLAANLSYFIGTWNCKGGPPKGPVQSATVAWAYVLGNSLVQQQIDAPAAGKSPAFHSAGFAAYDPTKKRLISSGLDEAGEWGISWSGGWVGNKITWHDVATNDGKLGTSVTIKLGPTTLSHSDYEGVKQVFTVRCTKAPS